MPMAHSPDTKLFYVPADEWGMEIWNEPITYKKGAAYLRAGFTIETLNDDDIGLMRAMDPKTGRLVWEVRNGAPLWGGVLNTGGGRRQDRQTRLGVPDRRRRGRATPSPGCRAVSSTCASCRVGAAPCRCGMATWRRRSTCVAISAAPVVVRTLLLSRFIFSIPSQPAADACLHARK